MSETLDKILKEGYEFINTTDTKLQLYGKGKERVLYDLELDKEVSRFIFQPKARLFYNGRKVYKVK